MCVREGDLQQRACCWKEERKGMSESSRIAFEKVERGTSLKGLYEETPEKTSSCLPI